MADEFEVEVTSLRILARVDFPDPGRPRMRISRGFSATASWMALNQWSEKWRGNYFFAVKGPIYLGTLIN